MFSFSSPIDFYNRMEIIKKREGFNTWSDFEAAVDLRGHSSRWKRGNFPSVETLLKINMKFGDSIDWLLTGKKPDQPKIMQPIIIIVGEYDSIPQDKYKGCDYFAVPLVDGHIAAIYDGPIPHDYVNSLIWIYSPAFSGKKLHNLRAVKIGDQARTMWRILRKGDIIVIDPLERPPYKKLSFKGIYAVRLDVEGGYGLMRVRESEDYWIFIADNPEYDSIQIKKSMRDENPIIGQIICVWRNLMFDTTGEDIFLFKDERSDSKPTDSL